MSARGRLDPFAPDETPGGAVDAQDRPDPSASDRGRGGIESARTMAGAAAKVLGLALFAFFLFGPLANLVLWSFAERWYAPFKLPVSYGTRYW